jgi:uncharacterized protein YggE
VYTPCTALALALSLLALPPASAQQPPSEPPSITVVGEGEVAVRPDTAEVQIGVVTQADSAAQALEANSEAMARLLDLLRGREIPEQAVQTAIFSVVPLYEQRDDRRHAPTIRGYEVTNQVRVRITRLETLGALLDALVSSGANRIDGITFQISEPAAAMDEARREAVADARRKAELYAREAGVRLGPLLRLQEHAAGLPGPQYRASAELMMAREVPVAPGEQRLRIGLSVTYVIDDGWAVPSGASR